MLVTELFPSDRTSVHDCTCFSESGLKYDRGNEPETVQILMILYISEQAVDKNLKILFGILEDITAIYTLYERISVEVPRTRWENWQM